MRKKCKEFPSREHLPSPVSAANYTRAEFDQSSLPCVYRAIKYDKPIYIGFSKYGLKRVFSTDLANGERTQAFAEADRFTISFYSTVEDALLMEAYFIHVYHPKFNKYCPGCPLYRGAPKTKKRFKFMNMQAKNG